MKKQTSKAGQDKTELHASKESEARFRTIFLWSPDAIIVADAKGKIEYMNPAAGRVFNREVESFIGKDFGLPLVDGESTEIDIFRPGKDPGVGDMHVVETEWLDKEAYLVTIRDITERKKVEEQLKETRDYLENLFNYANAPIIVWDVAFRITRFNHAFEQLTGLSAADVIGKKIDLLFPADRRVACMERIAQTKRGERWEVVEIPIQLRDGTIRTVLWNSATLYAADGKTVIAAIAQGQDITARKQAEETLQTAYGELKRTQSQLLQSAKLATVGELVAGVAHEINNPLAFIMGNLGALKDYRQKLEDFIKAVPFSSLDPQKAKELEEVRAKLKISHILEDMPNLIKETLEGAERINQIVLGLRNFARKGGGEAAMLDINQNIEASLLLIINELKYKAEIVKEYGTIPPVSGYTQQLSQVFMNILMNAAQSIEKYGRITIRTYLAGEMAVVEISDNGPGIPPENLDKVFDPFFTTKDIGKGTGLGLSIVYGIIERHKGTIEVQSEVGKGTTFVIRLPIK